MSRSAPPIIPRAALAALLWLALAAWAATILWLSSLSPQSLPSAAFVAWDKLNHFIAFAAGGWLAASALRLSWPQRQAPVLVLLAVVLVSAFGACDEALQLLTPGRSGADTFDWIADLLGAIFGASLTLITHARIQRLISRP